MNSRQRVMMAFDHQEADRVPMDIGTCDTFIAREVYEGMAKLLGIEPTAAKGVNHPGAFVTPDEKMLQILGADVRLVKTPWRDGISPWGQGTPSTLNDGTIEYTHPDGRVFRLPPDQSDVQFYLPAIRGDLTQAEIDRILPPNPKPWDWALGEPLLKMVNQHQQAGLAVQCEHLIMPLAGTSFGSMSFEQWSLELAMQPEMVCRLMDRYLEHCYARAENFYEIIGDQPDVVYGLGDDVAMHTAMWLSPADYRRYIKPRHAQIIQFIKKRTKAKIIHHCCGACSEILGDLIEIGVDGFNPTQTSATNMDPFELKRRFGKDLTFWGGIDVIHLLPKGSPADVEREVKRHIDALAPGGGYVFATSHIIQRFTPPENVLTMFRVAAEYGKY